MKVWGLVPARGGSKSIPLKNLALLVGRPLLDYVVRAGQASSALSRIICSTDNDRIADRARELGAEVDRRPAALATDDAKVDDVARDFLMRQRGAGQPLPDAVALLQPTSPFLQPQDIRDLLSFLDARPAAASAHNVYAVPHNLHAWNQRLLGDSGEVTFPFDAKRREARNKQDKPKYFAFGNLIAARTEALLAGGGFYTQPTYALPIAAQFAFDLDQQSDVVLAEAMITAGLVGIDHLQRADLLSYQG
jgi:CMP-N,N'-diacetyllegionaminic acid synthase